MHSKEEIGQYDKQWMKLGSLSSFTRTILPKYRLISYVIILGFQQTAQQDEDITKDMDKLKHGNKEKR